MDVEWIRTDAGTTAGLGPRHATESTRVDRDLGMFGSTGQLALAAGAHRVRA